MLATVSQSGNAPAWSIEKLIPRIVFLLCVMGAAATAAGFIGYALAAAGTIAFPPTLAGAIPAADHNRFLGVWFAHCTSYLVGLTGAGVLCYRVWSARGRPAVISLLPKNRRAWWRVLALAAVVGCIVWMRFLRR